MPLSFNFNSKFPVPRIVSQIYEYKSLEPIYTLKVNGKDTISIDVKDEVTKAWKYLQDNCAKSVVCNKYFANLSGKKTLSELMSNMNFVVHLLQPKTNRATNKPYTEEDLPQANSAGPDIGLSLHSLADYKDDVRALAAVLLHEIAHCGGASTDPSGERSLEAERSLIPCGLQQYFQEIAKG